MIHQFKIGQSDDPSFPLYPVIYSRYNSICDKLGLKIGDKITTVRTPSAYKTEVYEKLCRKCAEKGFDHEVNLCIFNILNIQSDLNVWHGCTYRLFKKSMQSYPFVRYKNKTVFVSKKLVKPNTFEKTIDILEWLFRGLNVKIVHNI